jgi:hypothetical protein
MVKLDKYHSCNEVTQFSVLTFHIKQYKFEKVLRIYKPCFKFFFGVRDLCN